MKSKVTIDDLAYEMAELSCLLAQTCNEKEQYFASTFGITPAEFKCLKLFKANKTIPIKEISSNMNISPGRITHILTSLEEKGYIVRNTDKNDRRNIIVSLTKKANPFIKKLDESHLKLHRDIIKGLNSGKRESIINAMRELITAIRPCIK